ncbi:hypothetical protein DRW07_11090 [Alteromonas sediminis]|uniref:Thermostable hemolysin n=1 Tax=Alteromonas sediminis TaxID=2259342 RepID=A0A3N5Y7A3_9ALTE|nr:thermostable hemolysin [Alteromonas sediminis]RPJ66619.1 hypothetical protein DRW07_11090 [Alteromonas sediminis]
MQLSLNRNPDTVKTTKTCIYNVLSFPFDRHQNLSKKFHYDIDLYPKSHAERAVTEAFIVNGFNSAYGAEISITMPLLVAIKKGTFSAALGLRFASAPLFVEQYLDKSVDEVLYQTTAEAPRKQIVEVGHLYSSHARFALPLLLSTGISLFSIGQKTIVFCATNHVRKLISGAGIPLVVLCSAEQQKLTDTHEKWGRYYETTPQVIAISTSDIMRAVVTSNLYLELFRTMSTRIQLLSSQLAMGLS